MGPPGLEPGTYGLKAPGVPEGGREVKPSHNPSITHLAIEVGQLIAERSPFAMMRAMELVEAILAASIAQAEEDARIA